MNYATVQDMVDRFGELELIQLSAGAEANAVDADKIEQRLSDAQAYLDGFVGAVYQLPLVGCVKPAPVQGDPNATVLVAPPQLTRWACDVARYYLYDQVAPEHEVFVRFKAARADLEAIAAGRSVLACPWGGQPGRQVVGSEPGDAEVVFGFSRQVNDCDLAGFR